MNPRLFLIARPSITDAHLKFLEETKVTWLHEEQATEAELLIEFCGRICYLSFGPGRQSPRTNEEYIANLIEQGHESVLEHASWTFVLSNVSRAFTHQLVRHRAGFSFSQLSQQYHDESDLDFVMPQELNLQPDAEKIWKSAVEQCRDAYRKLIESANMNPQTRTKEELRSLRSIARSILPNASVTTVSITANARSLRNFLKVRGAILGDLEMRVVSSLIYETFSKEAPAVFRDFNLQYTDDGYPIVYHNS